MIIDTDDIKSVGLAATAAAGIFAVVVRPRISQSIWARLGVFGQILDALCGNYGHTANAALVEPDDGKAVPLPLDTPR